MMSFTVDINMDDTQMVLKKQGAYVTQLTMVDFSGQEVQEIVLDWFDDDYLLDIANGIMGYLEAKRKIASE